MPTSSPWAPPVAPELVTVEPLYRQLLLALGIAARGGVEIPTVAAITALLDLAHDLAVNSGAAWVSPDFVAALRTSICSR
jgi:hypothetical protein